MCPVCAKPFREPHLAVCCGKHFCETCLSTWSKRLKGISSCLYCRAEGSDFNHVVNKGLRGEILELKVYCTYRGDGCCWVGELAALETHLTSDSSKGCGYVTVKCPYDRMSLMFTSNWCGSTLRRKDIKHHLEHYCKLRSYRCEYCGCKGTYNNEALKCKTLCACSIITHDIVEILNNKIVRHK